MIWKNWNLQPCWWECKKEQLLWKQFAVPQNVKQLPHDPTMPLLGMYSRELKPYIQKKAGMQMSIAALFLTNKKVEKNIHHLINGWKTVSINAMKYNLAIKKKRNRVLMCSTKWANLETWLKWKKPNRKGHVLYDSVYMKYLG